MSKLISGKEALIALANGVNPRDIEGKFSIGLPDPIFKSIEGHIGLCVKHLNEKFFRLKPQTITINGIDIAKPKKIDLTNIFTITMEFDDHNEAIKANKALKSVFKPQ